MANNIKIEKIWINTDLDSAGTYRHELRVSWSNDRHQSIGMTHLTPEKVKDALIKILSL